MLAEEIRRLRKRAKRLKKAIQSGAAVNVYRPDFTQYANDPFGYARDVLLLGDQSQDLDKRMILTKEIRQALELLLKPPYRVSIDSGHGIGKSFGAAFATNWWYDTRPECWVITTAPAHRSVADIVWTEIRLQRGRANRLRAERGLPLLPMDFIGPVAAEMSSSDEHKAKGYATTDSESFQGRHRKNMLFLFDEKEKIEGVFWDAVKSMFQPGNGHAWLTIGNPLTTTSRAYIEHKAVNALGEPTWHRMSISSLDHPNIALNLAGLPDVIPNAVNASQVDGWMDDWCDPVPEGYQTPEDICWRGKWYRPGAIGQPRILGKRPSSGTFGVWSEMLWSVCTRPADVEAIPRDLLPVIGNDCANYGTDFTVFHVRCGGVSLYHQAVNGWGAAETVERLKTLTAQWAEWATKRRDRAAEPIKPEDIPINIDDDANGRAVSSFLRGYKVNRICASGSPNRPDLYPNNRSELWFITAKKAAIGGVNFSLIPQYDRQKIELQAMAPTWWPDTAGRRVVESKDDLRDPKRLGRSPDDMDAVNLAYSEPKTTEAPTAIRSEPRPVRPDDQPRQEGRPSAMFGRR